MVWMSVALAGAGVSGKALRVMKAEAKASNSDAVVILHDGEVVWEHYSTAKPVRVEAMSATKSIVSLAVGRAVTTGVIEGPDVPVHTWFPEWKQGRKRDVTLRHLLNHTSGMQNAPNTSVEIYPSPDFVQLALSAELSFDPGASFAYNNKAVNLVPAVLARASGQPMDTWLQEDLFAGLGIDATWSRDQAGNPHGMSGLQIFPRDLARLGELVAADGELEGTQWISEDWLEASMTPSDLVPGCGLLWWLIPEWSRFIVTDDGLDALAEAGVSDGLVAELRPVVGRYEDRATYHAALKTHLGSDWGPRLNDELGPRGLSLSDKELGPIEGYAARGFRGQYLVIYPDLGLIGVRMAISDEDYSDETDGFPMFERRVRELLPSM